MPYSVWLPLVALAGFVSGQVADERAFGSIADILLGLCGAFLVRFVAEQLGNLAPIYLLLFSMWGAAALPAIARWLRHRHFKLPFKFGKFPSASAR